MQGRVVSWRDLPEGVARDDSEAPPDIFRGAPVMMHVTDEADRLVDVSDAWLDGLGYRRADVVGRPVTDLLTDSSRRYTQTVIRPEFLRCGRLVDQPQEYRRGDGSIMEVALNATPAASGWCHCVAVLVDVSSRNQAARDLVERERLYRETLTYAPDLIVRCRADTTVVFANLAFCQLLGRDHRSIVGRRLTDILPPRDRSVLEGQIAAFRLDQPILSRVQSVETARSGPGWIDWTDRAIFLRDGTLSEILSVGHDTTDLHRLADRIRMQNEKLSRLYTELSDANEGLRQFGRILSHDLQEPLRKMIGYTEILHAGLEAGDMPESRAAVAVIRGAARRSSAMVSDLVRYCRTTDVRLERRPVPLDDLLVEPLARLSAEIAETGAVIEIDLGGHVVDTDPVQARQIFFNLLSNALKYRAPGRRPSIAVACRTEGFGTLVVSVTDNGIGFDERYRSIIFEPFKRLHPQDAYPGSGIGLAICAAAARRLGWDIDASSRPDVGSTFTITIPTETMSADLVGLGAVVS